MKPGPVGVDDGRDEKEDALLGRLCGGDLSEDGFECHCEVQVRLWELEVDPCRLGGQTFVCVLVEHVFLIVVALALLRSLIRQRRGRSGEVRAPRRLLPAARVSAQLKLKRLCARRADVDQATATHPWLD